MKIAFGSDHGGIELKTALMKFVKEIEYIPIDCGTDKTDSADYPDYAKSVTELIIKNQADWGVLICKTGIGMSIAANKVHGIRAALAYSEEIALLSRRHNNANVICFGADFTKISLAKRILAIWLKAEFEGGRHQRRIDKIQQLEEASCEF
ncbi:MAG: ribose 5-phosphate isomerase B [Candidatus Marinimicrobia bacterium]|nr:ribose 5-phosphate isomerase B [Candidatus Neomarinimicrobiota bacterium]